MACSGKVSSVAPGRLLAVDMEGTPVTIANVGGQLFAFGDSCTHRGCSLFDGELSGHIVTCPCHGGQFDVTNGAVVAGPPREPVPTYPVRVAGDDFWVG